MLPKIELCEAGAGLLIPHPSGVVYQAQARGFSCEQVELEGVFVPFGDPRLGPPLEAWFEGPKYQGSGARHGLDLEDADQIDRVLRAWHPERIAVTVDRARLRDSFEAWVHVVIHGDDEPYPFSGFGPYPRTAVLTWTNSD